MRMAAAGVGGPIPPPLAATGVGGLISPPLAATGVGGPISPPSTAVWRQALVERSEIELDSFSDLELAAVGAGSPVRGLVASSEIFALDEVALTSALAAALRGLEARGLVGPPRAATGVGAGGPLGSVPIPLGGDLATVVAIRRAPALVAVVSAVPPAAVRFPGQPGADEAIFAILHGFAVEGVGLVGLLEEVLSPGRMHCFTLCTPARQAERLLESWATLGESESGGASGPGEAGGPRPPGADLSVHVYVPDPVLPSHTQLALLGSAPAGDLDRPVVVHGPVPVPVHGPVAVLSWDGQAWEDCRPAGPDGTAWAEMFLAALSGPGA